MNRFFTDDFFKFFFGFVAIIAIAFGVLLTSSVFGPAEPSADNIASPHQ